MDKLKNYFASNRDQFIRRTLIFVGTGAGIAIAAYAYAKAVQEPEGEIIVVEESPSDTI